MDIYLVTRIIKEMIALVLVVFIMFIILDVSYVFKTYVIPSWKIAQALLISKRSLEYYSYVPSFDIFNPSQIFPYKGVFITQLDGFTLLGERVGYEYRLARSNVSFEDTEHPLAAYIRKHTDMSYIEAVSNTAVVLFYRIASGKWEIWLPFRQ